MKKKQSAKLHSSPLLSTEILLKSGCNGTFHQIEKERREKKQTFCIFIASAP